LGRLLELFHTNPVRLRPALTDSLRSVRLYAQELKRQAIPQSVETMADDCGLGVTRFNALFKEVTGVTPGDYLLRWRIDAASQLLRTNPLFRWSRSANASLLARQLFCADLPTDVRRHPERMARKGKAQAVGAPHSDVSKKQERPTFK
jgi:AraC-like DNA-binding protein